MAGGVEAVVVGHAGHARKRRRALSRTRVVKVLLRVLQLVLGVVHYGVFLCGRFVVVRASRAALVLVLLLLLLLRALFFFSLFTLAHSLAMSSWCDSRSGASSVSAGCSGRFV